MTSKINHLKTRVVIDFGKYKVVDMPQELVGLRNRSAKSLEPFYWREILFKPVFAKGNEIFIKNYVGEIRGLRLVLYEGELSISNSLHKFHKGNNYSDFTRSDLTQSIDTLSECLGISNELILPTCLEVGVNLTFSNISSYLNLVHSYKQKFFLPMKKKSVEYGKKMEMTEVYIKAYDKSKEVQLHDKIILASTDVLRLEIGLTSKRQLSSIGSLANLKNENTLRLLQEKLLYYFELIELDECYNLDEIHNRDLELLYAGKNPNFWKNYRNLSKEVCKKRKQQYKKLCRERAVSGLKDRVVQMIEQKTDFLISN